MVWHVSSIFHYTQNISTYAHFPTLVHQCGKCKGSGRSENLRVSILLFLAQTSIESCSFFILALNWIMKCQDYSIEVCTEKQHNCPSTLQYPSKSSPFLSIISCLQYGKGQLISKGLFKVFICTKNEQKYFCNSLH